MERWGDDQSEGSECWQSVIVEYPERAAVVWHCAGDFGPVARGVVADAAVREFVDDDVAENAAGDEEERGIEHNHSCWGATSPLCFGEGDLHSAERSVERLPVDGAHQAFHAPLFRLGQEIPEEAVEGRSAQLWSDSHDPATLPVAERPCPRLQRQRENNAIDAAGCDAHGHGFSPFEEMAEGGDALFTLLFEDLFHHATEQTSNVFPPLFLREIAGEADDDGVFMQHGAGARVPRLNDPVADAGRAGHGEELSLISPPVPIAHFAALLSGSFHLPHPLFFPLSLHFSAVPMLSAVP